VAAVPSGLSLTPLRIIKKTILKEMTARNKLSQDIFLDLGWDIFDGYQLRRQAAVARSVYFACGLKPRSLVLVQREKGLHNTNL
jgi:hypothetical protein